MEMQLTRRSNGLGVSLSLRVVTLDLAFINMRDKVFWRQIATLERKENLW